nr:rcc01693 family protein [Phreatobacter sp.]
MSPGAPPAEPHPFPWDDALRLALGVIGWPPDVFWRATPRELAAALEGRLGRIGMPVDRPALDRLMAAYPD